MIFFSFSWYHNTLSVSYLSLFSNFALLSFGGVSSHRLSISLLVCSFFFFQFSSIPVHTLFSSADKFLWDDPFQTSVHVLTNLTMSEPCISWSNSWFTYMILKQIKFQRQVILTLGTYVNVCFHFITLFHSLFLESLTSSILLGCPNHLRLFSFTLFYNDPTFSFSLIYEFDIYLLLTFFFGILFKTIFWLLCVS